VSYFFSAKIMFFFNINDITQRGAGEDENFDFYSLEIPDDGCARSFKNLVDELERYNFSAKEKKWVIALTNYGQEGHPIWKLIAQARDSEGIRMPRQFILKRLREI
jgi:hypothetical protein